MPLLASFEQRRKRSLTLIKYIGISLVAFLLAHLAIIIVFKQPLYYLVISSLLSAIIATKVYNRFFSDTTLGLELKDQLFKALLPMMMPLPPMFEPERHVAFKYFQESGLFLHFPSSFGGANAVKGGSFEATFLYSELEAYLADTDGELVVFDGMFYVFNTLADFQPPIVIIPNRLQKKLGVIGRKIRQHSTFRGRYVKLFDEAFETEFSVYCHNARYAQQTVAQHVREKLLHFYAQTGADIYMSFVGRKIYIGLHNCPPIHFSIYKSCSNFTYISEMATKFLFPISLVSQINQQFIPPKAPPSWDI